MHGQATQWAWARAGLQWRRMGLGWDGMGWIDVSTPTHCAATAEFEFEAATACRAAACSSGLHARGRLPNSFPMERADSQAAPSSTVRYSAVQRRRLLSSNLARTQPRFRRGLFSRGRQRRSGDARHAKLAETTRRGKLASLRVSPCCVWCPPSYSARARAMARGDGETGPAGLVTCGAQVLRCPRWYPTARSRSVGSPDRLCFAAGAPGVTSLRPRTPKTLSSSSSSASGPRVSEPTGPVTADCSPSFLPSRRLPFLVRTKSHREPSTRPRGLTRP